MARELCIIHGNCQADPLKEFLDAVPEFSRRYETRLFTNYIRERVPDEAVRSCKLFLYQHLDAQWGDLASDALMTKLPPGARTLAFPNMFFQGYWPFWRGGSNFEMDDILLDRLLVEGLPKLEVLRIALFSNVAAAHDLKGMFEESLAHERGKEAHTPIKYVDLLLERFRSEMLFNTVNHPGHFLLCHLGREVLRHLEIGEPPSGVASAMPELHPEFRMPIHPKVAEFWGLGFAGPDTRYPVYGKEKTYAEYAEAYVDHKALGLNDFISYLRLR